MNILIVGSGFSGSVLAYELSHAGHHVTVIDQRSHIGGNAYDYWDNGILIHRYGPHIFHTDSERVWKWLSQFTSWLPYQHRAKALLNTGEYVPFPPNRETVEIVGQENITDTLYRPYSELFWNCSLEELDSGVLKRVPIRDSLDDRYYPTHQWQAMPDGGYTPIFEQLLARCEVSLSTAFDHAMLKEFDYCFNSMAIDEYFGYDLGDLPYRSVRFTHHTIPAPRILPTATVNLTSGEKFTRITEWKHFPNHGTGNHTVLTFEEPCDYRDNNWERYYPVKDGKKQNRELYHQYASRVDASKMQFIGRCGLYVYIDMHQAINASLSLAKRWNYENSNHWI